MHAVNTQHRTGAATPVLSVAMISYNQEKLIAQAIESVLSQHTRFSIELVISDDCSSDNTRAIAAGYAERYPDVIRLLPSRQNMGCVPNFVRTIRACTGRYVAFLEGDDYWTNERKLQLQVESLEEDESLALCHHRVSYVNDATGLTVQEFPPAARRVNRPDPSWLATGNFIQTCSVVLRRECIPSLGAAFCRLKVGDWPLFALLAARGGIGYIDENMAVYRIHANNSWYTIAAEPRARATLDMMRFLSRRLRLPERNAWINVLFSESEERLLASVSAREAGPALCRAWRLGRDVIHYRPASLPCYLKRLVGGSVRRIVRTIARWIPALRPFVAERTNPAKQG